MVVLELELVELETRVVLELVEVGRTMLAVVQVTHLLLVLHKVIQGVVDKLLQELDKLLVVEVEQVEQVVILLEQAQVEQVEMVLQVKLMDQLLQELAVVEVEQVVLALLEVLQVQVVVLLEQ